jgi:hypothetical protein
VIVYDNDFVTLELDHKINNLSFDVEIAKRKFEMINPREWVPGDLTIVEGELVRTQWICYGQFSSPTCCVI